MDMWTKPSIVLLAALMLPACASVKTEIHIDAPKEEVWKVLTDAEEYEEWNPVLIRADGTIRTGETVTYRVRQPGGEEYDIVAEVVRADAAKELHQHGGTWGILTFDHHWILEPVEGGTRVVQHENYRGIGVWFWDPSWFEGAYARALDALSARLEP